MSTPDNRVGAQRPGTDTRANKHHGKVAGIPAAKEKTQHSPAARHRKAIRHHRTQHGTAWHHNTPHHATGHHHYTTEPQGRQHRTQQHTTARGKKNSTDPTDTRQHDVQRNTAPQTQGNESNQHHRQSKKDGRAHQRCTTRQQSTTENRTQHRGAGRHSKPQHTAGQQATRPGGSTRNKTRQQKDNSGQPDPATSTQCEFPALHLVPLFE